MAEVEEIILLCANDEECPLSDLIVELSEKFGVGVEQAVELFLSASEFVQMREDLILERSEKFWMGLVEVDKREFFANVDRKHLLKRGEAPYFYISSKLTVPT